MAKKQKDIFSIDMHNLHHEWEEQPKAFHEFADQLVDAKESLERAKALKDVLAHDIKVVAADVGLQIRQDPSIFDLEKVTDKTVEAAILLSEGYQEARKKYEDQVIAVIEAQRLVDTLKIAVDTLDHKKKSLEGLVYLYSIDYFSIPKTPKQRAAANNSLDKARRRRERSGDSN